MVKIKAFGMSGRSMLKNLLGMGLSAFTKVTGNGMSYPHAANPATGDTSGMMMAIMSVLLGASLLAITAVALISAKKKKK